MVTMTTAQSETPTLEIERSAEIGRIDLAMDGSASRRFYFRKNSEGDLSAVRHVFLKGVYDVAFFRQAKRFLQYAKMLSAQKKELLILDAGANIGCASLYFCMVYPQARVVAIEPERKNAAILRHNIQGLPIDFYEAALSSSPEKLYLSDPGLGDQGFRAAEAGLYPVEVTTPQRILSSYDESRFAPLIFKIDIEGGEARLFEKNVEWFDLFPLTIVEMHDWMLPGEANGRNFLKTVVAHDIDFVYRGENVFCFNNRLLRRIEGDGPGLALRRCAAASSGEEKRSV
jgi:FkbM family methyltransferase